MNKLFVSVGNLQGFLVFKGKELANHVVWLLLVGGRADLIGGSISLRKGELRASWSCSIDKPFFFFFLYLVWIVQLVVSMLFPLINPTTLDDDVPCKRLFWICFENLGLFSLICFEFCKLLWVCCFPQLIPQLWMIMSTINLNEHCILNMFLIIVVSKVAYVT